ncbi:MAG TPA: endopeptidase La [Ruminococcus sp.]|nr:endopeptidase La [Ruminococcus sp.]
MVYKRMGELKDKNMMPCIAMRGLVAFPKMVMHFDIARDLSVKAVEKAVDNDRRIFLVAQKNAFIENPSEKDLYKVGVAAEIKQVLKTPDNIMRVIVEGIYKAKLISIDKSQGFIEAEIKRTINYSRAKTDDVETEAVMRSLKDAFSRYADFFPKMPKEMLQSILAENDPIILFENIAFNINFDYQEKQELLEENNIIYRLSMLYGILIREIEILEVERQIQEQVYENLDKNQKEYYLREQLNVIRSELGENDEQNEISEYRKQITKLKLSDKITEKLLKEADKLDKMPPSSQEAFVIKNYLDAVLELPWNKKTTKNIDLKKAREILDKKHYGLEKVKERILESIAVNALMPDLKGQIICLVGPPGVGKTSIGRSVAKALGRKYARVSLGGIKDESDIRGHRKTYVGAMPGRIINAVKQAGSSNPLILLDEIDKMSNDFRGDPSSAMLEVLDSEQNKDFRDHFIEVPFDLSQVLFLTTANTTETIPAPLLDRMEIIELNSYTREEKFHIAKEHLILKNLKKNGLKSSQIKIDDDALYTIIDAYTKEAGVRNLSRNIDTLCRKTAKEIVENGVKKVCFTNDNLEKYLGVKKFLPDEQSGKNQVGVVNGLAWTSVGGVMMPLEVLVLKGKGNVEITGYLGDVMKESAKLAVSYARSVAEKYNIDEDFYTEKDIHIHAIEGAVPKDGPSAGVTMTTAIISALSGIPVRGDVAMTGEITLHGKVLPIGGLKEKTMAAYKAGMKTVIVPAANKPDISEVDETVKQNLEFIYAETLDDVLENALLQTENNAEAITI